MAQDIIRNLGFRTLGSRFRRIGERLQAEAQTLIDALGLQIQSSHYPLLFALEVHGTLTVNALAEALAISQPGATRMVGLLEGQGSVAVRRGRTDKRKREVSLTPQGQALVDAAHQTLGPLVDACLAGITAGATGDLMDQLAHLETELERASFLDRAADLRKGTDHD